jgi:hypothetical protein
MLSFKFSPGDIITIKLMSGDEVIGRVLEDTTMHLTISRPLSMVMVNDPRNVSTAMIAFAPFILGADSETPVPIRWDSVVAAVKASAEAARQYQSKMPDGAVVLPPEQSKKFLAG